MSTEIKEGSLYERNHNHKAIVLCEKIADRYVHFRVVQTNSPSYKMDETITWSKNSFQELLERKLYALIA